MFRLVDFETLEGSRGLQLSEAVHIMIPGRGRSEDGSDLNDVSALRVDRAAELWRAAHLGQTGGVIVCSGYKSPRDMKGDPYLVETEVEPCIGIPEADSMAFRLTRLHDIASRVVRIERKSRDTVDNFLRVEAGGFSPDDRPAVIVAQEEHLDRILKHIAPKTMRREYIGVVAPEVNPETLDHDGLFPKVASWLELAGISADDPRLAEKVARRSDTIWGGVLLVGRMTEFVGGRNPRQSSSPASP